MCPYAMTLWRMLAPKKRPRASKTKEPNRSYVDYACVITYALSLYRYQNILGWSKFLCQTKRWFAFSKIGFCAGTKGFEEALNAVKFLGWLKKFGSAQNILGPVKGQGIRFVEGYFWRLPSWQHVSQSWIIWRKFRS